MMQDLYNLVLFMLSVLTSASHSIHIKYKSTSAAALDLIVHTCEAVVITFSISQLTRARDYT